MLLVKLYMLKSVLANKSFLFSFRQNIKIHLNFLRLKIYFKKEAGCGSSHL